MRGAGADLHASTLRGMLRTVTATRYVTPLREGGSLPGLVEADDDGLYVVKFRGAGQGPRALVAEWIAGRSPIGWACPCRTSSRSSSTRGLGDAEPDEELQDLVRASAGSNLGLDFLPGALAFNPAARPVVDPDQAAAIVWLDGLVTNPDRTVANPNLLWWHGRLWCIDHGAALYVHHTWRDPDEHARRPFERIADHVLLPFAGSIAAADAALAPRLDEATIAAIVDDVPAAWLPDDGLAGDPDAQRAAYRRYLALRLTSPRPFVEVADRARSAA